MCVCVYGGLRFILGSVVRRMPWSHLSFWYFWAIRRNSERDYDDDEWLWKAWMMRMRLLCMHNAIPIICSTRRTESHCIFVNSRIIRSAESTRPRILAHTLTESVYFILGKSFPFVLRTSRYRYRIVSIQVAFAVQNISLKRLQPFYSFRNDVRTSSVCVNVCAWRRCLWAHKINI